MLEQLDEIVSQVKEALEKERFSHHTSQLQSAMECSRLWPEGDVFHYGYTTETLL